MYGEREGASNGSMQGQRDGEIRGSNEGEADGIARSSRDALAAATPPGRAKGIDEANHSDASARGQADGLVEGDRDALAQAQAEDYTRGRAEYRKERFAEAVQSQDEYSQKQSLTEQGIFSNMWNKLKNSVSSLGRVEKQDYSASASPDRRFYSPNCNYSNSEERSACLSGYNDGYSAGFHSNYNLQYRNNYNQAYRFGEGDGCRAARSVDYRLDYQRGYQSGQSEGYARAYESAYNSAFRQTYDRSFRAASERAYQQNYDNFYEQHYQAARAAAYRERVADLYDAAFSAAHDAKFQEMYPKYAVQEYRRGRADETEDFRLRPVRLLEASVVETIPNGVFEPGEVIRVKVELRNFSDQMISAKDIKVSLDADSDVAVIPVKDVLLARDLKPRSLTTITQVLEFRLTESHVGERSRIQLKTSFQNRAIGSKQFELIAKYMLEVTFAEAPVLHEGMEGELKARIRNISEAPTASALRVQLSSSSTALEITQDKAQLGVLSPGETQEVTFAAIGRASGTPEIRLAIEVNEASGRRVGLLDREQQIPVLNDYAVRAISDLSALRSAGVFRAEYELKNVSSRKVMKSLQLHVRIKAAGTEQFAVLGPNPQYLTPLLNGQSTRFVIPVLVKEQNSGGILEFEVRESGQTVVVHQAQF